MLFLLEETALKTKLMMSNCSVNRQKCGNENLRVTTTLVGKN